MSPEKCVTSPTSVKLQKQPSFELPKPEIAIAKVPEHQARTSLLSYIYLSGMGIQRQYCDEGDAP